MDQPTHIRFGELEKLRHVTGKDWRGAQEWWARLDLADAVELHKAIDRMCESTDPLTFRLGKLANASLGRLLIWDALGRPDTKGEGG